MAEALTIARPYAEAAFKLAKTSNKLSDWSNMLKIACLTSLIKHA